MLQLETAFTSAWDAAAGDMTNPGAATDDLELADIEATDAWQQLQDSSGVASGSSQAVVEATQFALSRGVTALHYRNPLCTVWFWPWTSSQTTLVQGLESTGVYVLLNSLFLDSRSFFP